MPLLRYLRKNKAFRIGCMHACLNGLCICWIAALLYHNLTAYKEAYIARVVAAEFAKVRSGIAERSSAPLADTVDRAMSPRAPAIRYVLEDPSGAVLAGEMPPILLTTDHAGLSFPVDQASGKTDRELIGRVESLGADSLFIGVEVGPQNNLQRSIIQISSAGLVVSALVGFLTGGIMSGTSERRLREISRTSQGIIAGDLGQRIPLTDSGDEIDKLAVNLNLMLERNEQVVDNIRHISSDIVHDLRAPLNRLYHRIELARRETTTVDGLRVAIDHSLEALDNITETFTALLRISEIDTATQRAGFSMIDLNEPLKAVVDAFRPSAEEKRQSLMLTLVPDLMVPGDPDLLAQMLANLLENSIKYAPPEAQISVLGISRGNTIAIEIADNGPGIPEADRAKVFRPFFRSESAKVFPGTGLGLSLVAAIARLHEIKIDLRDNHPGLRVGLTFPM